MANDRTPEIEPDVEVPVEETTTEAPAKAKRPGYDQETGTFVL